METLTKRQDDTLCAIKNFMAKNGFPPTVRELAKILNLSSPATIQAHLDMLEKKNYIKRQGNMNRTIELLVPNEYQINNKIENIPLLGTIKAGLPTEAILNPDEFFSIPSEMIPKGKSIFALNVSGDSMINAGIFDGDIVIIEKTSIVKNGEIAALMNDNNEVTIKRFFKEKDYFRLQPENDHLKPIILKNVSVLGKLIGLYRNYKK